jgi:hypothetical protein
VARDPLTPKQRQIVDYMRGNSCCLSALGRRSLRRDGWSDRGIDAVLRNLVEKGLVNWTRIAPVLTEEGRRV